MGSCNSKANQPEIATNIAPRLNQRRQNPGAQTQSQLDPVDDVMKAANMELNGEVQSKTGTVKIPEETDDVKKADNAMHKSKAMQRKEKSVDNGKIGGNAMVTGSNGQVQSKAGSAGVMVKTEKCAPVAVRPGTSRRDQKHQTRIITPEPIAVDEAFNVGRGDELRRMRNLKAKFKKMDKDGNKEISRDEFLEGWKKHPVGKLDGGKVFGEMDINSSGIVSLSEFCSWYLKRSWNTLLADFTKIYKGGSVISKTYFIDACTSLALCSLEEADELFKKLDVNGDGELQYEEFSSETEQHYIINSLLLESEVAIKAGNKRYKGNNGKPQQKYKRKLKFDLVYRNGCAKLNEASRMQAFNQMDWQMKDRKLSPKEFITYFEKQGVSKVDSKRLFNDFDTNGNGFITFKEFISYLTKPQWETKPKKRGSKKTADSERSRDVRREENPLFC